MISRAAIFVFMLITAAAQAQSGQSQALEKALRADPDTTSPQHDYIQAIREHLQRHWQRPSGQDTASCRVRLEQRRGGHIVAFELLESCGSDALDRSVKQAILAADPLPRPRRRDAFVPELIIAF
ncbi:energy transducer TonB [Salinisphaera sp. P385]|uniref:Energy transducer TonB n=1 Tax=Spectribacter acetivorans TaxID=3075603 RepID=A0ABU3B874_9GAMM|nr:energy transducer TonB [Salinisphaera sp. P385]MDT0618434.1 energy transducer TonB [Salinisphaera sp. P385]